jgi:hypothetical protein
MATRESNRINREAFTAVQCAFVSVTTLDIRRGSADQYIGGVPQSNYWTLIPKVENSG